MASTIPPFSSLGRSIAATQPYAAPPAFPQTNYIQGSSPFATVNQVPASTGYQNGAVVSAKFRNAGMRMMYSYGMQLKSWFRSIATGQVESTKFQPALAYTWNAFYNDQLYAVGFPRNLGWLEKVPTLPPAALGISGSQMNARPQNTRSVYTRRSFRTAPSIPAKPQNG
jgi:hypothetical protein